MTPIRRELARKGVHMGAVGFALVLPWIPLWVALVGAAAAVVMNRHVLPRVLGDRLFRIPEGSNPARSGVVLYPVTVLGLLLLFPHRMELAAAAWGILALGDGMATVVGLGGWGPRLPWNRTKSWAGLLAFVGAGTPAAVALLWWTQTRASGHLGAPWVGASFVSGDPALDRAWLWAGCFAAAILAGFVETLDVEVDDNVLVGLAAAVGLALSAAVAPDGLADRWEVAWQRAAWGIPVTAALAGLSAVVRAATIPGALLGWLLAATLWSFVGWPSIVVVAVFVALGTGSTWLGRSHKERLGVAEPMGGRRGAANVLANVGVAAVCAFLSATTARPDLYVVALVAAVATSCFDTVASEVGKAFGRTHVLLHNLRRARPGAEGAVSLEGTLAGALGAVAVGSIGWWLALVDGQGATAAVVGAAIGAMAESWVGASMPVFARTHNDLMNLGNTVVGATAAVGIWTVLVGP